MNEGILTNPVTRPAQWVDGSGTGRRRVGHKITSSALTQIPSNLVNLNFGSIPNFGDELQDSKTLQVRILHDVHTV